LVARVGVGGALCAGWRSLLLTTSLPDRAGDGHVVAGGYGDTQAAATGRKEAGSRDGRQNVVELKFGCGVRVGRCVWLLYLLFAVIAECAGGRERAEEVNEGCAAIQN
jgi:hypothetical protein